MNGACRVLDIGESAQWMDYLKRMHSTDIHFEPRYYQFYNNTGDAKLF